MYRSDLVVVWIGYIFFGGVFEWANFSGMIIGVCERVLRGDKVEEDANERPEESE